MAWKVIQVILERRLEMCDQPMGTVRPRCTRVKPGKGVHSGNYYKLPQIGRIRWAIAGVPHVTVVGLSLIHI